MQIIINWIVSALVILAIAYILPGVGVSSFWVALVVALVLGLINAFIRPIVLLLTLPINLLTLGLFTLVIDTVLILLAAWIVTGFDIGSFWWAFIFSIALWVVNMFIKKTVSRSDTGIPNHSLVN